MFAYIGVPPPPPLNNLINARAPSLGPRLSVFSEVSYNQDDKLMGRGGGGRFCTQVLEVKRMLYYGLRL